MIDIHTHILFGVDDGARTLTEALDMIAAGEQQGVDEILLTPHGNWAPDYKNYDLDLLERRYQELCTAVRECGFGVKLHLGMEVLGTEDIGEHLRRGHLMAAAGTKYMLVEFPFQASAGRMFYALEQIEKAGLRPVIAHAERYYVVQDHPEIAYDWNRLGYAIQINKGSLFGEYGRGEQDTAHLLLECNLAQIIASDCHGVDYRRPGLARAWDYISDNFSPGYAELLMELNPRRMLEDQDILIINPCRPIQRGYSERSRS